LILAAPLAVQAKRVVAVLIQKMFLLRYAIILDTMAEMVDATDPITVIMMRNQNGKRN
jgi:hypothetical protein